MQVTVNRQIVFVSAVLLALVGLMLNAAQPQMLALGILLGVVFQFFSFGFANFWRQGLVESRTLGMRSHLLLLAFGGVLFFPALALLPAQGVEVSGAIRPLGMNVLVGAFLFGLGMALVGSCSSGTLRHMGSLNGRFYLVFLWMVVGGTFAASQADFWLDMPVWGSFSAAVDLPWYLGLALHLIVILALYKLLLYREQKRFGVVDPLFFRASPLMLAVLLLAVLNFLILLSSHSPWAVSWIFPKLGVLGIQTLSLPVEWEFWAFSAQNETALSKSLLDDGIVLTSVGMLIGVSLAFALQGGLHKDQAKDDKLLIEEVNRPFAKLGRGVKDSAMGTLMGYGAVTAYGCNVGGFFSAIVSGSLHGWLWMLAALTGMSAALFLSRLIAALRFAER
ncbi:YeeE/YedE thiosulfate transporter family protein [Thiomicrorhabdus xiamenensis]|uniref:YeeE/YedE family protein n=1 Tax=Thiomicrorhabdus xiamenensis TaxID=2739063 RepID=A0A7D4TBK6_9GAMM|nr:YeeE/YedE thiosulfate transporter family protein [Thiomicrorhabdus xiamenensis]QKI89786.1 YeeE/YedE family protein [Thiomicrorhabdus xiamenensis]